MILWAFNSASGWLDFAVSMVEQLRSIGYQHFAALGMRDCCAALQRIVPDAPCVTYHLPGSHWEVEDTKDFSHTGVLLIWIARRVEQRRSTHPCSGFTPPPLLCSPWHLCDTQLVHTLLPEDRNVMR